MHKILTENSTGRIKYAAELPAKDIFQFDNFSVIKGGDNEGRDQVVGDLNSSNSTVYEVGDLPEDFAPDKYSYDGNNYDLNESWVDPN